MIKKGFNAAYIDFILENIRKEDLQELRALWGDFWKKEAINSFTNNDCIFSMVKDKNGAFIPIAVGGFQKVYKSNPEIVCVWLISTIFVEKNKKEFLKDVISSIKKANKEYYIMYNYIYEANTQAKKWLKKLGFNFENPKPKDVSVPEKFEFFYKTSK